MTNPVFDVIMPFVTELKNWLIPAAIVVLWMAIKGGKRERLILLLLIPIILLSDQLSSSVIKPLIGRLRPCIALPDVHLLVKKKKSLSFPSSHATNMGAVALAFTFYYRRYWWAFAGFALLIGFSRVYVGVHYPFDVLAGYIIGGGCAAFVLFAYYRWLQERADAWLAARKARKDENT